jgi:hypothetical protein
MKKMIFLSLAVAFMALPNTGCVDNSCEDMRFQRFREANRIEIKDNRDNILRTLKKPSDIHALVEFTTSHKSGWNVPWTGAPIALITAEFYQGDKFLGDFGLGSNFLAAQGCGYFQSRDLNPQDRAVLIQLFGVKDP